MDNRHIVIPMAWIPSWKVCSVIRAAEARRYPDLRDVLMGLLGTILSGISRGLEVFPHDPTEARF